MSERQARTARERKARGTACWLVLFLLATAAVSFAAAQSEAPRREASQSTNAGVPVAQTSDGKTAPQGTSEYRLSRERYEKAVAYSRAGYRLYFLSVVWGIAVLYLLLRQKVVARIRDMAEARSGKRFLQALIFVPGLLWLLALLHLPLRIYWHKLSFEYEQSVEGWGSWMWDWTKGELISAGIAVPVALLLLWVIRWKPEKWWLYFWFAIVPLSLFVFFISPWVLDPVFNKFVPLEQKHAALVQQIGKLTERAELRIPPERMFLMEASKKTNRTNAYVTGIAASKRVVVWDTTIQKMSPDEVLVIVGHEMGHYVLGHVVKGFLFFTGGMLVGLYVAYRALRWILKRCGEVWGVRGQNDWAALAVLLLIMNVLEFAGMPVGNGFSRMQEHAADVYGLELTHGIVENSSEVAAHAFQVMGELDLADPHPSPMITFWLYSHPPQADRLKFAHDYDPWSKGESPKYVK